jgi:hypothetical protein
VTTIRQRPFKPGPETWYKERDFRGLLGGIQIPICTGIHRRHGRPTDAPYVFVDLHGGPGNLSYDGGPEFPGSPLIAIELLLASDLPFETIHFEKDADTAVDLQGAIASTGSPHSTVRPERFESGMRRWLQETGPEQYRNGLIYSDPIGEPIPVDTFNEVARCKPRVDLLAYISATNQYKRPNGSGYGHGRRPADDILAVRKKHVLIREAARAEQYTFILWTNWTDFPKWTARGFHDITSAPGRRILDTLNLTKTELHNGANTPLPFESRPEPSYRSYREYLRHPKFLKVRAVVFDRANGLCERCHQQPPTEPHHLRYPPWGTFDVPENMIAVCHPCHCEIHGKAA